MNLHKYFNSLAFKLSDTLPMLSIEQYDEKIKYISSCWAESLSTLAKFNDPQKELLRNKLTANYKRLPELEYALKVVFLRLNGDLDHIFGKISEDAKTCMITKLSEDLPYCIEGFHDRISEIILSFAQPNNLEDLLQLVREDLVLRTAIEESQEVHVHNAFFSIAHVLELGVRFRNQHDQIGVDFAFSNIQKKLMYRFEKEYTPLSLPYLMCQYIKTTIAAFYVGKKENPGYEQRDYKEITTHLNRLLSEKKSADFYFSTVWISAEEDVFFYDDLNWRQIEHLILGKLYAKHYFKINAITDLPILTLEDMIYGSRIIQYEPFLTNKLYRFISDSHGGDEQTLLYHETFFRESDSNLIEFYLQNQSFLAQHAFELSTKLSFERWYQLMKSRSIFYQFIFHRVKNKLTWIQKVLFLEDDMFIDQKYLLSVLVFFLSTLSSEETRLLLEYVDNKPNGDTCWKDLMLRLKGEEGKDLVRFYITFMSHISKEQPEQFLEKIYSISETWELFSTLLSPYTENAFQNSLIEIVPFLKQQITKMQSSSWTLCLKYLIGGAPENIINIWQSCMIWHSNNDNIGKNTDILIPFLDYMVHVAQHLPQSHLDDALNLLITHSFTQNLHLLFEHCCNHHKIKLLKKSLELLMAIENRALERQRSIILYPSHSHLDRKKHTQSIAQGLFNLLLLTSQQNSEEMTILLFEVLINVVNKVHDNGFTLYLKEMRTYQSFDNTFLIVCADWFHKDCSKLIQEKWRTFVMTLLHRISRLNDSLSQKNAHGIVEKSEQLAMNLCYIFQTIAKIHQPITSFSLFTFFRKEQNEICSPYYLEIRDLYFHQMTILLDIYNSMNRSARITVQKVLRQETFHKKWFKEFRNMRSNDESCTDIYNTIWNEESSRLLFCCLEAC